MLVPTNESKEITKKYGEVQSEIRDLISSISKNSDDYDEKYIKIKFDQMTSYLYIKQYKFAA